MFPQLSVKRFVLKFHFERFDNNDSRLDEEDDEGRFTELFDDDDFLCFRSRFFRSLAPSFVHVSTPLSYPPLLCFSSSVGTDIMNGVPEDVSLKSISFFPCSNSLVFFYAFENKLCHSAGKPENIIARLANVFMNVNNFVPFLLLSSNKLSEIPSCAIFVKKISMK